MTALTILSFGESGHGKSTLFETAPGPRLLLDSEGKAELLEGKTVVWSDLSVIPEFDEDTTVILPVRTWQRVNEAVRLMERMGTKFRSFGVDSFSRLQEHLMQELTKGGEPDWDTWSAIKARMTFLFDALAGQAESHAAVVYNTCWMVNKDKKFVPLLDGAIKERASHYHIVTARPVLTFDDKKGISQNLHIFPGKISEEEEHPTAVKSNSVALLAYYGKVISEPNLTHMHGVLNKQITKQTTETK